MTDAAIEKWWPAGGSCREDCPHEIAKRVRDEATEARAHEIRHDPQIRAEIAEFRNDMAVLRAGGPAADELRRKWYDRESHSTIQLLMGATQEVVEAQAERDDARAVIAALLNMIEEARWLLNTLPVDVIADMVPSVWPVKARAWLARTEEQ